MRQKARVRLDLVVAATGLAVVACSSFAPGPSRDSEPTPDASADACVACDADGSADAKADADGDGAARDGVAVVRAGGQFACALRSSGTVWCWGRNDVGQTGQPPEGNLSCDDTTPCRPTPMLVPGLTKVTHLAAGMLFACARRGDGAVLCWGSNALGALGTVGVARPDPAGVPGLPPALDVSAGSFNACARVAEDGGVEVYCWGTNREGMLGTPATSAMAGPTRIPGLAGAKSVVLSRASEHGCAIRADDSVVCWGTSSYGSLGHAVDTNGDVGCGSGLCNHLPIPVVGLKATELALGLFFGCARVVGTDEVACWGYNGVGSWGQGGFSDSNPHPVPTAVPLVTGATSIVAGGTQVCALVAGTIRCWGGNGLGELGNGNASDSCLLGPCKTSPESVLNLKGVVRITAGSAATFASTADGSEWAWGSNPDGRLGHPPGASNDLVKCTSNPGRCNPVPQPLKIP